VDWNKENLVKISSTCFKPTSSCNVSLISFFFNFETIKVFQTTAVFHSLHQRQDKALADQEQMIPIITTLDLSETEYQELTFLSTLILLVPLVHVKFVGNLCHFPLS
jgi:hypothetical protein